MSITARIAIAPWPLQNFVVRGLVYALRREEELLRLFPVSHAFQLFYNFDQSLKPPLIVGYSRAMFRAERIDAVLFGEFRYFLPQFLDTLCDGSRHNDDLLWHGV